MNRLQIFRARSGDLTAQFGPRQLHSRFDPRKEADRFVSEAAEPATRIIVIGPGLGYAIASLRTAMPRAKIIACSLCTKLSERLVAAPDVGWNPASRRALDEILSAELSDLATSSLLVLEWSPVVEAFADQARIVRECVSAHLRRSQASLVTQGAFGRRWLRNRLHNYLHARPFIPTYGAPTVRAVVLAGAGPSLEAALPHLARRRESLELWVTGSALDAVVGAGVRPDAVVVTDAAVYATEHLRSVLAGPLSEVPVAAPLSASRGVAGCSRLVVISEGDAVDRALLPDSPAPPLVPPHGTVTASAAQLVRGITPAPIVLVGVDFAWKDERSHARPHLAETYRRVGANRLLPESRQVFESTRTHRRLPDGWSADRSLDTYAEWFESAAPDLFSPISALEPSPRLHGLARIHPSALDALPARFPRTEWAPAPWPEPTERRRRIRDYLHSSAELVRQAAPPSDPASIEAAIPRCAELATRLALPQLLRWYNGAEDRRPALWDDLVRTVGDELEACMAWNG